MRPALISRPSAGTDALTELRRVLVNLLISSTEALTLAVAANDIAQFVKYHENGKKCVRISRWPAHADSGDELGFLEDLLGLS